MAPAWLTLILLSGVLVLAIGGGIVVIVWARRQLHTEQDDPVGLDLEDYRKLLDDGLLDPREYERIRARLERHEPPPETSIRPGPPPA